MLTKTKPVYYCEFCKRNGLSRHAMEAHERRCTMNPSRACKWCQCEDAASGEIAEEVRARAPLTAEDIIWLRTRADGCPPCMLAALRQSGVPDWHYDGASQRIFDYDDEVKRAREDERAQMQYDEYRYDL